MTIVARFICVDVEPRESSLIILNLDEVNVLLDARNPRRQSAADHGVLRALRGCSRQGFCFFAVLLTSTAILKLSRCAEGQSHRVAASSSCLCWALQHMCEVVLDVARRCTETAEEDVDAEEDIGLGWLSPLTPAILMQRYPLFALSLRLLGGNCRFLEELLFRLGYCTERHGGFSPLQFLSSLQRLHDSRFLSEIRCSETAEVLHGRYRR